MANTPAKKITYDNKPVQVESAIRDGTGKVINENYLQYFDSPFDKFPDFDTLSVKATYTATVAATSYYCFATATNTGLTAGTSSLYTNDRSGFAMFRISCTNSTMWDSADVIVKFSGGVNNAQRTSIMAYHKTHSTSSATTGIRYLRALTPKALNSGYGWALEFANYNTTSRTIKVEVIYAPDWLVFKTPAATTYTDTYQVATQISLYSSIGLIISGTSYMAASSASSASSAGYLSSYLPAFGAGANPYPSVAFSTLTMGFVNNAGTGTTARLLYKLSTTNVALDPTAGLVIARTALTANAAPTYNNVLGMYYNQTWATICTATGVTACSIARGNSIYARFTLSDGQLYSDGVVATQMTAGHTWKRIGTACSSTVVNIDMRLGSFITLDSNGNVSAIDGKPMPYAPLASPALTGTPTAPTATAGTNTTQIATTAFVKTAIDELPEPMLFKGTLGTGGTITSLPTAAAGNEGFVYKVITAGTYASQAAKIGDLFICANVSTTSTPSYAWTYVPSGDEPSGTVTNVATGAELTGGPITTSGTISHATSGVTAGTYQSVTVNTYGHVTAGSNPFSSTQVYIEEVD